MPSRSRLLSAAGQAVSCQLSAPLMLSSHNATMLICLNARRQPPPSPHTAECMCIYAAMAALAYSLRHQDPSTRIAMSARHGQVPVARCLIKHMDARQRVTQFELWLAGSQLAPSHPTCLFSRPWESRACYRAHVHSEREPRHGLNTQRHERRS